MEKLECLFVCATISNVYEMCVNMLLLPVEDLFHNKNDHFWTRHPHEAGNLS